jgi:membrane protein implicated in regulation of membrane protease activity
MERAGSRLNARSDVDASPSLGHDDGVTVLARYLGFQIPGWIIAGGLAWALGEWASVPDWVLAAVLSLYVLKDLILFPFVRSAYAGTIHDPGDSVKGAQGIVVVALDPEGWVRIGPERWRATVDPVSSLEGIEVGRSVRVTDLSGHHLWVAPDDTRQTTDVGNK